MVQVMSNMIDLDTLTKNHAPDVWAFMNKVREEAHLYTVAELDVITEWATEATLQAIQEQGVREWEEFSAVWPHAFVMMESGVYWEQRNADDPQDTGTFGALDGLEDWLRAECGERGTDWDEAGGFVGIKDPDAAFWFRVRWL
jgi:hypothetical protein